MTNSYLAFRDRESHPEAQMWQGRVTSTPCGKCNTRWDKSPPLSVLYYTEQSVPEFLQSPFSAAYFHYPEQRSDSCSGDIPSQRLESKKGLKRGKNFPNSVFPSHAEKAQCNAADQLMLLAEQLSHNVTKIWSCFCSAKAGQSSLSLMHCSSLICEVQQPLPVSLTPIWTQLHCTVVTCWWL